MANFFGFVPTDDFFTLAVFFTLAAFFTLATFVTFFAPFAFAVLANFFGFVPTDDFFAFLDLAVVITSTSFAFFFFVFAVATFGDFFAFEGGEDFFALTDFFVFFTGILEPPLKILPLMTLVNFSLRLFASNELFLEANTALIESGVSFKLAPCPESRSRRGGRR